MEHQIFICKCHNIEHQLVFSYFKDEPELYVTVHLNPEYSFWKRLKLAIKYIFGYRSMYGEFDEFIFNEDEIDKLENIVKYLKNVFNSDR